MKESDGMEIFYVLCIDIKKKLLCDFHIETVLE